MYGSVLALRRPGQPTRRCIAVRPQRTTVRSYAKAAPEKGGKGAPAGKEEAKAPKPKRPNVRDTDTTETGLFGSSVYTEIKKKEFKDKSAVGDQFWSKVKADEARRATRPTDQLKNRTPGAAKPTEQQAEEVPGDEEVSTSTKGVTGGAKHWQMDEEEFQEMGDFLNTALRNRNAYANDPVFSEKAKYKAWELHKSHPAYWNRDRLANLFKVSLARMKVTLWQMKLEEDAKKDGVEVKNTVEELFGQVFGESFFPNDISDIPDRIPFKNVNHPYFFIEGDLRPGALLKQLRNKTMNHYKESPRYPKQAIPQVKEVTPKPVSRTQNKVYPGRYGKQVLLFDLSQSKNMYTRNVMVRELDGSYRTGNWQERRWIEDHRRYLKFPDMFPYPRPDESQPDHVPEHARVPNEYQEELSYVARGNYVDSALKELADSKQRAFWDRIMVRYE